MKLNRMIAFVMVLMFAAVLFAGCASEPVAEETTTETPAAEALPPPKALRPFQVRALR